MQLSINAVRNASKATRNIIENSLLSKVHPTSIKELSRVAYNSASRPNIAKSTSILTASSVVLFAAHSNAKVLCMNGNAEPTPAQRQRLQTRLTSARTRLENAERQLTLANAALNFSNRHGHSQTAENMVAAARRKVDHANREIIALQHQIPDLQN